MMLARQPDRGERRLRDLEVFMTASNEQPRVHTTPDAAFQFVKKRFHPQIRIAGRVGVNDEDTAEGTMPCALEDGASYGGVLSVWDQNDAGVLNSCGDQSHELRPSR